MQYISLGRTGLKVSKLCLGTMNFGASADETTSFSILDRAVAGGINFLDTSNIYSKWIDGHVGGESEIVLGKWLKTQNRRDIIIATKSVVRCGMVQMAKDSADIISSMLLKIA